MAGNEKSIDEIVEEFKQHPAFMTDFDETKPMSPALEALQILKYESNSNDENALNYKIDGNKNFQRCKYHWAIDNYTAGLKCAPTDPDIIATLYANRAAANYRLCNYRSALLDCSEAIKIEVNHAKAWSRGLDCLIDLQKLDEALSWSKNALKNLPDDEKIIEKQKHVEHLIREKIKKEKRQAAEARKEARRKEKILLAIRKRKLKISEISDKSTKDPNLSEFDSLLVSEGQQGNRITLSDEDQLVWPVLFLYPEFAQSDLITSFNENMQFQEYLIEMLDVEGPSWDEENNYKSKYIHIYFEEKENANNVKLIQIPQQFTLLQALQLKQFTTYGGLPTFLLTIKNTYEEKLLTNYKHVHIVQLNTDK